MIVDLSLNQISIVYINKITNENKSTVIQSTSKWQVYSSIGLDIFVGEMNFVNKVLFMCILQNTIIETAFSLYPLLSNLFVPF